MVLGRKIWYCPEEHPKACVRPFQLCVPSGLSKTRFFARPCMTPCIMPCMTPCMVGVTPCIEPCMAPARVALTEREKKKYAFLERNFFFRRRLENKRLLARAPSLVTLALLAYTTTTNLLTYCPLTHP